MHYRWNWWARLFEPSSGMAVIMPVALLVLLAMTVALAVLGWTAGEQTRLAAARSQALARVALEMRGQELALLGEARGGWARAALGQPMRRPDDDGDPGPMDGQRLRIDTAFVLDSAGRTTHATIGGRPSSEPAERHLAGGFDRLREAVRRQSGEAHRAGLLRADGHPALVSLGPVRPPPHSAAGGERVFLVLVSALDEEAVQDLGRRYLLPELRLLGPDEAADRRASLSLRALDGSPLGSLAWRQPQPGLELLARLGPALTAALVGVLTLVTLVLGQSRRAAARLRKSEQRAFLDALTGLPNRRLLHDRLARTVAQLRREGGFAAVFYLDLDRFKQINDTHGHETGDRLLVAVASRLRQAVRKGDTVARMGGDEFAVLQAGIQGADEAAALATRLSACLDEPFGLGEERLQLGLSIGIALAPEHGLDGRQLLRLADRALYRAKAAGRGSFCFFTPARERAVPTLGGARPAEAAALLPGGRLR
ncbi:MAG TPA: diguanylate cyclase [Geminicoccaceae bacterium]|nr:diguanylate cyclase [Geminicoccaceae bacterium]